MHRIGCCPFPSARTRKSGEGTEAFLASERYRMLLSGCTLVHVRKRAILLYMSLLLNASQGGSETFSLIPCRGR
jgi:hypothetical protein